MTAPTKAARTKGPTLAETGWEPPKVPAIARASDPDDRPATMEELSVAFLEAAAKGMEYQALCRELAGALLAFDAGLKDGSIKWARPRRSDSDPYHPANVAMCAALAKAREQGAQP